MDPRGRADDGDSVCAMCGGSKPRVLLSVAVNSPRVDVVRCRRCGLEFLSPLPSDDDLHGLYDAGYYQQGYLTHSRERIAQANRRADIVTRAARGGRLLDVGCGVGFFLRALPAPPWEVEGVELSAFAADYARKAYGLRVRTGALPHARFDPETYDAITMFDVIGHLRDPRAALAVLRECLKKTGILIIEFPNFDSPWHRFNWLAYRLWGVNRLHVPSILWRFRLPTLGRLLAETGYQIVRLERSESLALALGRLRAVRWAADVIGAAVGSPNEFLVYAQRR